MKGQQTLPLPANYLGEQAWNGEAGQGGQLETIRAAVNHLGPKEVAWEMKIDAQRLSDALNNKQRKSWHARWTHILKAMLHGKRDATSRELLRALVIADVANTPFEIDEPEELSSDDIAHGYRNADRKTQQAIARLLDGGRR